MEERQGLSFMYHRLLSGRGLGSVAAVLASLLVTPAVSAQVCAGFAALDDTRFRLSTGTAVYRYANAHSISVATGRAAWLGARFSIVDDNDLDATAYAGALEVGADVVREERSYLICPLAGASYSIVPIGTLMLGDGLGLEHISAEAGFGLAGAGTRLAGGRVHPLASFRITRIWWRLMERRIGETRSRRGDDMHFVAGAGMGFVIGDRLTVRPGVAVPFGMSPSGYAAVPFGRENNEIALDLSIGFNFGRRTPAPDPDR